MPLETYTLQRTARPDGPSRLSPLRFWRLRKRGKAWRLAEGLDVGIEVTCFTILFAYLKVGSTLLRKQRKSLAGATQSAH